MPRPTRERSLPIRPILISAGVGAILMYLLDPHHGRRRRAILRDKSMHLANVTRAGAGKVGRDTLNRLTGLRHQSASLLHGYEEATDDVTTNRVRSQLGRIAGQARDLDVEVRDGVVRLSGAVPKRDARRIVRRVRRTPGVRAVESLLATDDTAEPEVGDRATRHSWTPTTRAASAIAGAAALSWAATRPRSASSMAMGATGAALLARGLVNRRFRTMIGVGDAGPVRVRKTVNVDAPLDQVYHLWSRPELFPRFLPHLERVEPRGNGRYHWVATLPGGARIDWDAEVTEVEPNRRLAWRSLEGSKVDTSGTVRLDPQNGGTRIEVDLSYVPPAGLLGYSVARLIGRDPRTVMNQDLVRFKSLLENGKTRARGEEISLEEILAQA